MQLKTFIFAGIILSLMGPFVMDACSYAAPPCPAEIRSTNGRFLIHSYPSGEGECAESPGVQRDPERAVTILLEVNDSAATKEIGRFFLSNQVGPHFAFLNDNGRYLVDVGTLPVGNAESEDQVVIYQLPSGAQHSVFRLGKLIPEDEVTFWLREEYPGPEKAKPPEGPTTTEKKVCQKSVAGVETCTVTTTTTNYISDMCASSQLSISPGMSARFETHSGIMDTVTLRLFWGRELTFLLRTKGVESTTAGVINYHTLNEKLALKFIASGENKALQSHLIRWLRWHGTVASVPVLTELLFKGKPDSYSVLLDSLLRINPAGAKGLMERILRTSHEDDLLWKTLNHLPDVEGSTPEWQAEMLMIGMDLPNTESNDHGIRSERMALNLLIHHPELPKAFREKVIKTERAWVDSCTGGVGSCLFYEDDRSITHSVVIPPETTKKKQ